MIDAPTAIRTPGRRAQAQEHDVSRGRPRLPKDERADVSIRFRCRSDEKQLVEQAAEADGKSLSEWIRAHLIPAAKSSLKKRRPRP